MEKRLATDLYLTENLELRKLQKVVFAHVGEINNIRRNRPYSLSWQIWKRLRALNGLKSYVLELILGRRWLLSTYKLSQVYSSKSVIVCANGPSQGLLDKDMLALAKSRGSHLVAINFFLENKTFYLVKPDIVVISDWATWRDDIDTGDLDVARKRKELRSFLKCNEKIKIFCPSRLANEIACYVGSERVYGFSDSELIGWSRNINPLFPRGYHSQTAYKALALSLWLGYKTIYCIGFDNTYPREVFCDIDNRIMERSTHACTQPYVRVLENCYENMGEYLNCIAENFHSLSVFPTDSIVNLDEYSLTDRFRKIKLKEFRKLLE